MLDLLKEKLVTLKNQKKNAEDMYHQVVGAIAIVEELIKSAVIESESNQGENNG